MKWRSWTTGLALLGWLAAVPGQAAPAGAPEVAEGELSKQIRKELLNLPYYGVFDLLTYQTGPQGVVRLGGYVRWGSLQTTPGVKSRQSPG